MAGHCYEPSQLLRKQLPLPPILKARAGSTYQIAHAVSTTTPRMLPTSHSKLDAARTLFDRYLEPRFRNALGAPPDQYEVITPKLFQHHLFTKARRDPKRIVRPCVDITFQAPHAIDATCFHNLTHTGATGR